MNILYSEILDYLNKPLFNYVMDLPEKYYKTGNLTTLAKKTMKSNEISYDPVYLTHNGQVKHLIGIMFKSNEDKLLFELKFNENN